MFNFEIPTELVQSANLFLEYVKPFYLGKVTIRSNKIKMKYLKKQVEQLIEFSKKVSKDEITDESLLEIVQYDFLKGLFLKEIRKEEVLKLTLNHLNTDTLILSDLDPKWLYEFYNYVEKENDEKVLNRWALILSGYINNKKMSIRALNFFNNCDESDIKLIERVGKYLYDGKIISNEGILRDLYKISDFEFEHLIGIGFAYPTSYVMTVGNKENKVQGLRIRHMIDTKNGYNFIYPVGETKVKYHLLSKEAKEILEIPGLIKDRLCRKTQDELNQALSKHFNINVEGRLSL